MFHAVVFEARRELHLTGNDHSGGYPGFLIAIRHRPGGRDQRPVHAVGLVCNCFTACWCGGDLRFLTGAGHSFIITGRRHSVELIKCDCLALVLGTRKQR